jgi:hypothetical protein
MWHSLGRCWLEKLVQKRRAALNTRLAEDKSEIEQVQGDKEQNNGDEIKNTVWRDEVEDEVMMGNDNYAEIT